MDTNRYIYASLQTGNLKDPIRIDKYLVKHLAGSSRQQIQRWLQAKLIHIDGRVVSKADRVRAHQEILVYTPFRSKLEWLPNPDIPVQVVFEDEFLLILNKPQGLQLHPAQGNYANTLINGVVHYAAQSNEKPFLVHRLDKHTAGLVIVAKSKNAQQILMQQFQTGSAKRIYQGLVWGRVLNQVSVENDIGRDGKNPKNFRVYISGEKGGKHAVTHVKPIEDLGYQTLVECSLETGRTHQIRVHLSHKGFPLVGDFEYGGDTVVFGPNDFNYLQKMDAILQQCNGQMLWACKLSFSHPNSRNRMDFKLQTPREFQSIMHQIKAMEADRDGL